MNVDNYLCRAKRNLSKRWFSPISETHTQWDKSQSHSFVRYLFDKLFVFAGKGLFSDMNWIAGRVVCIFPRSSPPV